MTFVQRLAAAAGLTEQRLTDLLANAARNPAPGSAPPCATRCSAAESASVPSCVIESAALFGIDAHAALDAAAAFECVHCYSLVHDDLPSMDDDDLRRGQPTVHKAFDEWTAILAGDALLTLAFEIAARRQTHPDAGVRAELARVLAHAAGGRGMVLGQMLDLEAEKRGEPPHMSAAHVRRLQALKTGALIAAACEAGAVMAGAADEQRATLRRYGENLGLAFQIADDLLDARRRCCGDGQGDRQGHAPPARRRSSVSSESRRRARNSPPRWRNAERELEHVRRQGRAADRSRALRRQPRALSRQAEGASRVRARTPCAVRECRSN